ncbi:MAG: peptide chain release factor N(5)-glutamine methyltransferase [Sporolactobacillus sp.]|jgi:release factor glutamine methyltransferase|nr:peptide chain release factor N(5)-glutamine methyltransferase [Sporolactobacillus sp.]
MAEKGKAEETPNEGALCGRGASAKKRTGLTTGAGGKIAPMSGTRFELLRWARIFLKQHGRDENIGEILLMHRLSLSRTHLLAGLQEPLAGADAAWLRARVIEHVRTGRPVQYMIGRAPFCGRDFMVAPGVLIPRPDTEMLVVRCGEWASRFFSWQKLSVCEIGTGSGAVAVTLSLEHPQWKLTATDVSPEALAVAEANAGRLGASLTFRRGDLFEPLRGRAFDVLVSNPPYISRPEMAGLSDTVGNFEPHLALCGGEDGLDFYRRIFHGLPPLIRPHRRLLLALEIGAAQGAAVANMIRRRFGKHIVKLSVEKDLAGLDRNVMAVLQSD